MNANMVATVSPPAWNILEGCKSLDMEASRFLFLDPSVAGEALRQRCPFDVFFMTAEIKKRDRSERYFAHLLFPNPGKIL